MNNVKLISSGILMLISFLATGQEKGLNCIPQKKGMRCTLSFQTQNDTLYTLNNIVVSKELIKEMNPESITSKIVLDKGKGQSLYGSQGRNGVVIIKTNLSNRKIVKMKKNMEMKKTTDTIQ
jgi:hypothetical protein